MLTGRHCVGGSFIRSAAHAEPRERIHGLGESRECFAQLETGLEGCKYLLIMENQSDVCGGSKRDRMVRGGLELKNEVENLAIKITIWEGGRTEGRKK